MRMKSHTDQDCPAMMRYLPAERQLPFVIIMVALDQISITRHHYEKHSPSQRDRMINNSKEQTNKLFHEAAKRAPSHLSVVKTKTKYQ